MQKKKSKRNLLNEIPLFYKTAALFLFTVSISAVIWTVINISQRQIAAPDLFLKYYNPSNDKFLNSYGTKDYIMQEAFIALRNADLAAAHSRLSEISPEYDSDYKYHIMKALIFIEKGESEPAKELLKTAKEKSQSDTRYIATWYLGLLYLKEGDIFESSGLFASLASFPNLYQKDANRILRKVKTD